MATDPSVLTVSQYFSYLTDNDAYAATLYDDEDEMAGPGLGWETIQDIIACEDHEFEETVTGLNMRELLDLVSGLQNSMAEEQRHFDELSMQLEMLGGGDEVAQDDKQGALSAALCTSQMRLARLCTRNMRCFTQQAVRAKQNHHLITRSSSQESGSTESGSNGSGSPSPPTPTREQQNVGAGLEESSFRDRLRFFQQGPDAAKRRDKSPPRRTWGSPGNWAVPPNQQQSPSAGEANLLDDVDVRLTASHVAHRRTTSVDDDLDAEAFVVHKTEFDEGDFLAEDGYSSVCEDPDAGSIANVTVTTPDDEYIHENEDDADAAERHAEEVLEDEDLDDEEDEEDEEDEDGDEDGEADFVDNSAAYASAAQDPRGRYVYYPDDKELEVILEEDEEDLEDTDVEDIRARYLMTRRPLMDDDSSTSESSDDDYKKRTPAEGESDSGVPDEGSSSPLPGETSKEDIPEKIELPSPVVPAPPEEVVKNSTNDQLSKQAEVEGSSTWVSSTKVNGRVKHPLITSIFNNSVPQSFQSNRSSHDSGSSSPESQKRSLDEESLRSSSPPPTEPVSHRSEITLHLSSHVKDVVSQLNEKASLAGSKPLHLTNGSVTNGQPELVRPRSNTLQWDPTDLLEELYKCIAVHDRSETERGWLVTIEGYLEKLPSGKKKATYWNPWKRRYFKVFDCHLHCYDNSQAEEPKMSIMLMGGTVERLDDCSIGVDDRKGHFITLRCQDFEETDEWFNVLSWHARTENYNATYVHPVTYPLKSHKNIVIVDLGSCSTRAGLLMDHPTLPQVFFPTVCATNKQSQKQIFGSEALLPHIRLQSTVTFPIMPTAKITKYTMDVETLPAIFKKVFTELNIDPRQYMVLVCIPRSFSLHTQVALSEVLLEDFGVTAINLTHQAILTLYAYRATSGVVVDIGDRMDIIPISQGYIVENGISRLPYGGRRIAHHLNHTLAQKQISLISDVESYLLRYLLEQGCYVAENYDQEMDRFRYDPDSIEKAVPVRKFYQDQAPFENVTLEQGRFHAPEGLFNPRLWGLDSPGLAKLVHRAIQECGMDLRREMARSIYLSGGVSCLPGFPERLEAEIGKLMPASVEPKVHASPYRYHMAYLGACQLAQSPEFENVCVSRQEWRTNGRACLNKWHL